MAIFGNKDKKGNFTINFGSVKDTVLYDYPNTAISATLQEDRIEFKQRVGKNQPIHLMLSQITKFGIVNEKQIEEVDKSIVKRAVVGGLLLGPLGAIVGGIDGIGKKEKIQEKKYFVINYNSNNEEKALPLEIVGATIGINKFIENLMKKCPNLKKVDNTETYL